MKNVRIVSIPELEQLLASMSSLQFKAVDRAEAYAWIAAMLKGYHYRKLTKHERGIVQDYVSKMTALSERQVERLTACWLKTMKLQRKRYARHSFSVHPGRRHPAGSCRF